MKKYVVFSLLITVVSIFLASALLAVPPTDEVIQRLKDEGQFDEFLKTMAEAHAQGVDSPSPDVSASFSKRLPSQQTTFRVLVILIDFPDKPYTAGSVSGTKNQFDSILFSEGKNPTGSMTEFYYENSYGQFGMIGDVVGWYRAANSSTYYTNFCDGSHGFAIYPHNAQKLVEEAVDLADPAVDYSLYDNDGNGYVDGIFVVHAGSGYEESGSSCEIHSHQWNISPKYRDGVYVSTYSMEPEESAANQTLSPIGVFCHEFGHVLGLPDLYDTDYSSAGAGHWALMASGSYNGRSRTPSHLIAWSKIRLGWMAPINITANQTGVELPAVEWTPTAYRLWKNGQASNEYFIIENRQMMGFDSRLPGSGILVWHIDDNVWGNTNEWHPQVFLEQADGRFDLQHGSGTGDGGDPYPTGGAFPQFTDKTMPDSKAYNLTSTQVALWNISLSDSIMTTDLDVSWSRPYLHMTNYAFSDAAGGDGDGVLEAGETVGLTVTIANDWKPATSVQMNMTIDDATLGIISGSAPLGTIGTGGSASNAGSPLTFTIPSDYVSRIDSFYLQIVSDGGAYTTLVTLGQNVGKPAVILVDDDNGDDLEKYYTSPLQMRRMPYDLWSVSTSGVPGLSNLTGHEAVVWFVGDYQTTPLTTGEVSVIQSYLDSGGKLFLTGQGIAAQLVVSNPGFLSNYLKSTYLSTSLLQVLTADSSGQVFPDFQKYVVFTGGSGAANQTKPDHLANNGGTPELEYYNSTDLAAISYAGTYSLVFFAYGMEAIMAGDSRFMERDTVFNHVIDFFGVSVPAGYPDIASVTVGPGNQTHLTDHSPFFSWPYHDAGSAPQQAYHVQVGTDNDWAMAELWDHGPITASDTFAVYAGGALYDGATYYVRVQVFNGIQWSVWRASQFRMNSIPTVPSGLIPSNLAGVTDATPSLQIQNAGDDEGDLPTYDYEVYADSALTVAVDQAAGQPQGSGSSSWSMTVPLSEDAIYYWRARAFDGFEHGNWSPPASFWVNASNQLPTAFDLLSPADSTLSYNQMATFSWSGSHDDDRFDTARYRFILATNEAFSNADTVSGLTDTVYASPDSLIYGVDYHWKVVAVDNFGGVTPCSRAYVLRTWLLGDADGDGQVNLADIVMIINYIFKGGAAPNPLKTGDVNQDCAINISDAVYLIGYIFKEGPPPLAGCE